MTDGCATSLGRGFAGKQLVVGEPGLKWGRMMGRRGTRFLTPGDVLQEDGLTTCSSSSASGCWSPNRMMGLERRCKERRGINCLWLSKDLYLQRHDDDM